MIKSKKFKIIIIIGVVLLVVAGTVGMFAYSFYKYPPTKVNVDGNILDDKYFYSGSYFFRIEDRLYYVLVKDDSATRLVEISEKGIKTIISDRFKLYPTFILNGVYKHGDTFYKVYPSFSKFDFKEKEFEEVVYGPGMVEHCQIVGNNIYYIISASIDDEQKGLYVTNGEDKKQIATQVKDFYATETKVYYIDDYCVVEYDIQTQSQKRLTTCDLYGAEYSIQEKGIVYCVGNSVYRYDFTSENEPKFLFNKGWVRKILYAYNDKIYYTTEQGLYEYDPSSNTHKQLYSGTVTDFYIVDDKWIYMIDGEKDLYRVLQEGGDPETVLVY